MNSSEVATAGTGRFSGGRSTFSRTCSLLSQYMKEKGSFPDLKLSLTTTSTEQPKTGASPTVNYLPTVEKSESDLPQMTIFYGGQVVVLDDLPADKAKHIMMLASTSSSGGGAQNYHTSAVFSPPVVHSPSESATTTFSVQEQVKKPSPEIALVGDLPIARKNSLARFLEKRKDRIVANAPYQMNKPAAAPPAKDGEKWLGITSQGKW